MTERHVYRLIVCPRCGLRSWTVDQEPAPLQHSHPQTGAACVSRVPFNELFSFTAEDQGPGLHPRQVSGAGEHGRPQDENAWLRLALRAIEGPADSGPFIEAYREAGGAMRAYRR